MNFLIVIGGGILQALAKKGRLSFVSEMGKGVVHFGWLAWFIGIILILNSFNFSEKAVLPELGPCISLGDASPIIRLSRKNHLQIF